ncbi:very-short-patch-repair endonuclease [Microbacterium arborescens]|nr:very-short-patch-repair endonuclease [Microbacterium arborescens]
MWAIGRRRVEHGWGMCESRSVFTTRELRADGLSRREITAAVDSGRLSRIRIGMYASPGACTSARAIAAHGGSMACVTAARHHGLWTLDDDDEPHVWLKTGQRAHHDGSCGCIEHWDRDARAAGSGPLPLRQVLRQILGCRGPEHFFVTLESALRQRRLTRDDLRWLRRHTNARGREAVRLARTDADSGLESLLRWRLRKHGLRVRTQVSVFGVGVVDALIGDRLIVELDGRANHHGSAKRHKDLTRDANAASWGYVTLRFDYALVIHDWELVESAILGALRSHPSLQLAASA